MKKLLMVLLATLAMATLAMAATSSLATNDLTVNDKLLSLSALGSGDFTEVAIPLAAPFEYDLSLNASAGTCPISCCTYYWNATTQCCVPKRQSCSGHICLGIC